MLSIEHQIQIDGYTLFRDLTDVKKYYYLPKGDVRVARNGKALNYFALIDAQMKQKGTDVMKDEDVNQSEGFMTLEVELGPTESEIETLRDSFVEKLPGALSKADASAKEDGKDLKMKEEDEAVGGDGYTLVPVPFDDGDVHLYVLGQDGKIDEKKTARAAIVGSTKPSLFGRENASFSMSLDKTLADVMLQTLRAYNTGIQDINSQFAVTYDLKFKAIEPAHHLKIDVDFNAVEEPPCLPERHFQLWRKGRE